MKLGLFKKITILKKAISQHKEFCFLGVHFIVPPNFQDEMRFHHLPIQKNKIVIRSFLKKLGYSCNPKYIAEELIKQDRSYDIVWIVNKYVLNHLKDYPKKLRLVMEGTDEELFEYSTAKVWIDNERLSNLIKRGLFKRSEQVYINTWHGASGLKAVGRDRHDLPFGIHRAAKLDSRQIDYLISNSLCESKLFKRFFWNHGKILELGHPRNDIFFKGKDIEIKHLVYDRLGVKKHKRLLLYAPTYRNDQSTSCFTLDYERIRVALETRFGGEWVVGIRAHYLARKEKGQYFDIDSREHHSVINCTDYSDTQELLVASDALITDYSTIIFDFMLTERPAFFFATDRSKHKCTRGQYRRHEDYPFPLAEDNEKMVSNILEFDEERYVAALSNFKTQEGYTHDDGHASERVASLIQHIIENEEVFA